jgi:hypothetical protein
MKKGVSIQGKNGESNRKVRSRGKEREGDLLFWGEYRQT